MQSDVIEQELSRKELLALKNRRTGMAIFQISWIMVFVCLALVNLQIRSNFTSWPPEGITKLGLGLPTIATILLVASGFLVKNALKAVQTDYPFVQSWRIALGLGVAFVLIIAWEWMNAPVTADATQQYGVVFRVMTAFHVIHALVVGAYMYRVDRFSMYYNAHNYWAVEAGAKLWYFVIVAWLIFYVVLYWI